MCGAWEQGLASARAIGWTGLKVNWTICATDRSGKRLERNPDKPLINRASPGIEPTTWTAQTLSGHRSLFTAMIVKIIIPHCLTGARAAVAV